MHIHDPHRAMAVAEMMSDSAAYDPRKTPPVKVVLRFLNERWPTICRDQSHKTSQPVIVLGNLPHHPAARRE